MSSPLRIAVVAEGRTDLEVLKPIIESLLGQRSFVLNPLQPEGSEAFPDSGGAGEFGGGWVGVYRWCAQSNELTDGQLQIDPLFQANDILIVHIDADVASKQPSDAPLFIEAQLQGKLPCEMPCPPAGDSVQALRILVKDWLGSTELPENTVICIPSKCMEAWVLPILFPDDKEAKKANWECFDNPERRLGQQKKNVRIEKSQAVYRANSEKIKLGWSKIAKRLDEALRFQTDLQDAITYSSNNPT